ncbi:DUF92 domain-containing protein [Tumebacillus sp. ITR2]|uniref:DUF92 domain-containing protein n=1 Tax=Tumebacillus amylolyticus TaxID=2801339 RepID=A0ABS1J7F4_9BACL|nr:DUF92 domain-containing protein [Tumebacillus amylolyticus]MBL0386214.1 DUF92 domain-containing protein [Tumebacillus amylolyticus]
MTISAWILGLIGATVIAGLAYWKRSLSASGFAAAVIVGTVLYACGSLAWFGTLIAFFLSSSVLSKFKQRAKSGVEATYEKSGRRDAGQVFANGGIAVILCLLNVLFPHFLWWAAFVGVLATVNADTWATEIGGLSQTEPRSILTLKKVPTGTSGGISLLGTLATMAGGLFIGLCAWLLSLSSSSANLHATLGWFLLTGLIAGTIGSLVDSMIGAKWQWMQRCVVCGKDVEAHTHCSTKTSYLRGEKWMNNDAVNLIASLAGAIVAVFAGV